MAERTAVRNQGSRGVGEDGPQELKGFGRVGLGYGHGSFGGGIVFEWEKLRGPLYWRTGQQEHSTSRLAQPSG
jgi:hypothetical protein